MNEEIEDMVELLLTEEGYYENGDKFNRKTVIRRAIDDGYIGDFMVLRMRVSTSKGQEKIRNMKELDNFLTRFAKRIANEIIEGRDDF